MKTKIRLRQGGVKNHPLWHIVVQGEKKNLRGKYIEKIGYWMPRQQKTYQRGIVLNKHKMRYWLSVGAEPTGGVIRLLNRVISSEGVLIGLKGVVGGRIRCCSEGVVRVRFSKGIILGCQLQ